jgi:lycopene cyclase domain-containing protein
MPDISLRQPLPLFRWLLPILGLVLLCVHWFCTDLHAGQLLYKVQNVASVPFFETRYLYLYAHLFALVPILFLSFDRKVAFHKEWRYLLPALFLVAIPYWIWDIAKTSEQVWGFNPKYYTFSFLHLPIEEWFFFITFPWASVFIYLCLNAYFPENKQLAFLRKIDTPWTIFLITLCLGVAFWNWGKAYTTTSFMLAGLILLWQFLYGTQQVRTQFFRMFPVGSIAFILVNSVFTGAFTEQPIVVYNPEEYLGLRFITIPLDDFSYNLGLEFSVICLYEWFKNRRF